MALDLLGARDLGIAFYSGMTNGPLQGQISIPGQVVFAKIGIEGIPVYNVENACASGSSAFNLALQSLKAGTADVALALGAEKMNVADKAKAFSLFEAGWDVSRAEENYATLLKMGEGVLPPPGSESDKPYSRFMVIYAALCRYCCGIGEEPHALGAQSQFRKPFTVEEILAAPPITYPLARGCSRPAGLWWDSDAGAKFRRHVRRGPPTRNATGRPVGGLRQIQPSAPPNTASALTTTPANDPTTINCRRVLAMSCIR
ncbi:MAG: beta-ketoacyl synthase N-terminal-like domain-containing protein [Sinimarinibacterium sp.]|jgi:acetyl-CoA acetyltransferase